MKYSELLELYKKNELSEELKQQVESDIERQDAISEYLFEKDNLLDDFTMTEETSITKEDERTSKLIKQKIRMAFLKMGIVSSVIVAAILLFIIYALPEIVSSQYYNPGEIVYGDTNQMSLDMKVYTELKMHAYQRDTVNVRDDGYGKYYITIPQFVSYNSKFTNVAGIIDKNELQLFDINMFKAPPSNAFAWIYLEDFRNSSLREIKDSGKDTYSAAGGRDQATNTLNNLDEYETYVFYATLDRMMPYDKFIKFLNEKSQNGYWCVPYLGHCRLDFGFECASRMSTFCEWDKEKYPNLIIWETSEDTNYEYVGDKYLDSDIMKDHFINMLDYMCEQKEFLNMMNEDVNQYKAASDYMKENELLIYGYAGVATKDTLLELNELPEVYEIYVQELR